MFRNLYLAAACTLLLAACGDKVSGRYVDQSGTVSYVFKGGEVVMTVDVWGNKGENTGTYTVDGDQIHVVLKSPVQTSYSMTIDDDGNLVSHMGLFKKD